MKRDKKVCAYTKNCTNWQRGRDESKKQKKRRSLSSQTNIQSNYMCIPKIVIKAHGTFFPALPCAPSFGRHRAKRMNEWEKSNVHWCAHIAPSTKWFTVFYCFVCRTVHWECVWSRSCFAWTFSQKIYRHRAKVEREPVRESSTMMNCGDKMKKINIATSVRERIHIEAFDKQILRSNSVVRPTWDRSDLNAIFIHSHSQRIYIGNGHKHTFAIYIMKSTFRKEKKRQNRATESREERFNSR